MLRLSLRPFVLAAFAALALGLAGCGDEPSTEPTGDTPYGTKGAQTPYAGSGDAASGYAAAVKAKGHIDEALAERASAALASARQYLVDAQLESGGWGIMDGEADAGITGMAAAALVAATPAVAVGSDDPIRAALDYLVSLQKDDGSIFSNPRFVNYMTSAATGALALAKIGKYASAEREARDFIASSQIAGDSSDLSYGGFPYKQDQGQVSDLSNAQFAVQALADAGLPKDSEVWKRLVTYLSRVQNRSESNDIKVPTEQDGEEIVVVSGDDGGAGYSPGTSKAGLVKRSDGTYEARSYGSMTYALLKCYLLAGVDADDPRVQAAFGWISDNYTLDRNPGFEASADPEQEGQQGYYYYLYTLARTLAEYERATGAPLVVKDGEGKEHHWRADVVQALLQRQQDDGTWVNEKAERWMEGAPILATSYAVVALAEAVGRFR